jgi:hypothetical protein
MKQITLWLVVRAAQYVIYIQFDHTVEINNMKMNKKEIRGKNFASLIP